MPKAARPANRSAETTGHADTQRRVPTQERSRARLARILACAEALIAASGSDRLRMAEVADAAGISIGSLYQYFPDKSAIIHTLAAGYNAACRETIVAALKHVTDVPGFIAAFTQLMNDFYGLVRNSPVIRDIWAGMQADRALSALQLDESRAMGALLAVTIARVRPRLDPAPTRHDGISALGTR